MLNLPAGRQVLNVELNSRLISELQVTPIAVILHVEF
jgi:hypothetical protein